MKRALRVFRIATNKYTIAVAAFALQMLFFDDNNLFVHLDRKRQLNDLLANKAFYEERIATTNLELRNLQSNPDAIEKFVRENFMMKRDNEDVFVVEATIVDDKK